MLYHLLISLQPLDVGDAFRLAGLMIHQNEGHLGRIVRVARQKTVDARAQQVQTVPRGDDHRRRGAGADRAANLQGQRHLGAQDVAVSANRDIPAKVFRDAAGPFLQPFGRPRILATRQDRGQLAYGRLAARQLQQA